MFAEIYEVLNVICMYYLAIIAIYQFVSLALLFK